jgi:23S rRNA (adenine1618-N6)-methyltransferase
LNRTSKTLPPKGLHPRNLHLDGYDFDKLIKTNPALASYVFVNDYGTKTINFADSLAVLALNQSLLAYFYEVYHWEIPQGYLCPAVPGRADYIHYLADLLAESNNGIIPKGNEIKCLDIGVGANCIYPIIGHQVYGWGFVGADIDPVSVRNASTIVKYNEALKKDILIRFQSNKNAFFEGVIEKSDFFHATLCNPPFYSSVKESVEKNSKKNRGLGQKNESLPSRNFGGNANELWCKGGELWFILSMIRESVRFAQNCQWFTSLVSNKENIDKIFRQFDKIKVKDVRTIAMAQGQKISRMVAWRF